RSDRDWSSDLCPSDLEHRVQRAGDLHVGEVASLALEQPLVFDAGNGLADPVAHAPSLISVGTLRTGGTAKALLNGPIAAMSISKIGRASCRESVSMCI